MVFGVEMLFGFVPFKTGPLFALMLVSTLSFFCCLVCSPTTFFSFFSLSQALGKPKPRAGFGVPLVFLLRGRVLQVRPVLLAPLLHQGSRPALCFFFCFRRSRGCFGVVLAALSVCQSVCLLSCLALVHAFD